MKFKGVIFDLDGTVLDTEKMNIIPLQKVIKEELGKEIAYEELVKYRAYTGKKTIEMLGFKDIEKTYAKWVKYVNEFEEGALLYPGFREVFQELQRKGLKIGVASSKMRKQYEIDFYPTGLQDYLGCAVLAEDTELHKPDPQPLLLAANLLEIQPEALIYVGDTIADEIASRAAGMKFALASWGALDISQMKPDFLLKNPEDILKFI